ncbi:MAG: RNA-binding protein [Myxococcales bacterium]|nr:RNA-binding protein [Myxococcales bacterium]
MALKDLFRSTRGKMLPQTNSRNHEGAPAYELDSRTALAQLAATGCFGSTFYVSGREQLDLVLQHAGKCEPAFVAKVALYARERGFMKDMPAVLLAHLSTRGPEGVALMKQVFSRVIDNGRMLRNFVQVMRSGQLGRKSLGTAPKREVQKWLAGRSAMQLFRDSIGNDPSLVDVVKMVHPKPSSDEQKAMYGYLLGREYDAEKLPGDVRKYEAWKQGEANGEVPNVPYRMLDGLSLGKSEWTEIAKRARWHETRMNLNTYQRHGVFDVLDLRRIVATRLASQDEVRKAKVFPYQLLVAWKAASGVPSEVQSALQDAMEHAVANVPLLAGRVVICPDVSGSMAWSPITGHRRGSTSGVRCIDVAGLIVAALLRQNDKARVIPFETDACKVRLNPRDSVMTLANQLAQIGGGGTRCSAPLSLLRREKAKIDTVIFVSDNESWVDARGSNGWSGSTAMLDEWKKLRARSPGAKLICIDLTPNIHKQAIDRPDILNVGGFSDTVFDIVAQFAKSDGDARHWADLIDQTEL